MSGNIDYCTPFIKLKAQLYNFLLAGNFYSFINKILGKTRSCFTKEHDVTALFTKVSIRGFPGIDEMCELIIWW